MNRTKVILILITLLLLVGVGGLGWWLWSRRAGGVTEVRRTDSAVSQGTISISSGGAVTSRTSAPAFPKDVPSQAEALKSIPDPEGVIVHQGDITGGTAVTLAQYLEAQNALNTPPAPLLDPGVVVIPDASVGDGGASATPVLDGAADPDADGLTNDQERQQGSDPSRADTDGDGLADGAEVRQARTDVRKTDTDGDGLSDGEEFIRWKTDPLNPDTDGDTYPDGTEVKGGYNPKGQGKL